MQNVEENKIVIRLPSLHWRALLSLRFFLFVVTCALCSGGFYWFKNIYPFLQIRSAYLNAFSTSIYGDAAGKIIQLSFQEGDFVQKGEILFSIEQNSLSSKQLEIQREVQSLNQQVEFEKGEVGKAMTAYLAAAGSEEAPLDQIEKYVKAMEEAQGRSEAAAARLETLKKEENLIAQELKKAAVKAPFEGVVVKKYKDPGSILSYGEPVCTLVDPNQCWIEAEIPEKSIGQIAMGTGAKVHLTAYPKKEFKGQVSYIAPATMPKKEPFSTEPSTVLVKITVAKEDLPIFKPGLSAQVALKVR